VQSATRSTEKLESCNYSPPLADGKSNKEIAAQLGISVRTVEKHKAKIMLKLGFHSLAELIHYALRQRIIAAPSAEGYPASWK